MNKSLFRVHGSRLARYCVYFQKLFESDAGAGQNETIDGCPVYHVPAGLSSKGFKDLLKVLDTPLCVLILSLFAVYSLTFDPHRIAESSPTTRHPRPSRSPCS